MEQRISLVTLGVADLARARAFYEALGWAGAQQPDDEVCFFQPGGSVLGLWTALGGHGAPGVELAQNVRTPDAVEPVLEEKRPGLSVYCHFPQVRSDLIDGEPGPIRTTKPKAAFYIFPKIDTKKFNILDDEQFALDLLKDKHILVTHGGGFHWNQPDHFRIVYLPEVEVLKEACGKLADFLKTYHQ